MPRAEFILAAAIAIVSILVLALVLALRAENPARTRTLATIVVARTVRDETLALTQAMMAAEAERGNLFAGAGSWVERRRAQFQAHASIARLRATASRDAELLRTVNRISQIVEEDFQRDDAILRSRARQQSHAAAADLPLAVDDLINAVNARNDVARRAENAVRARLDSIGIALGVLSLIASGLAMFSLSRERRQWRIANAIAEGARARAAASDLAKTRFLAAASHDMRQPLHALTLYLSALNRRVHEDEARGILKNAESAAQSLASMFSVLLDLARIEANVIKPEMEDVSLQDVFHRVVAEYPGANVVAAPASAFVRSDPVLLERILRNLVSNALKHGGGEARIAAIERGNEVEILVTDDGPGIPQEDQQRVFDEFVRLENTAKVEGLGLGLSIVQRLSALMGHKVELRSASGEGATFVIRASRVRNPEKTAESGTSIGAPLMGADAIVVDDDALARSAMAGALHDLGAQVRACADEAELEAALAKGAPKLIVLDLRLDGRLVGIDISKRLGERFGDAARVIIVTGDTAADTLDALRASGRKWLIKPVDPRDLAEAVA